MKFDISVTDFQYAMRLVRDVVPTSGPMAESTGVLVMVDGDTAVFTASNPELLAKATVKIKSKRGGEVVVDAAALHGALSHFHPRNEHGVGTSDITVVSSPKARKLQISATTRYALGSETHHKRVFPLRNQEFFPEIPSPEAADQTFELSANILMDAIDGVSYAVSTDKAQHLLTGVLLRLSPGKLITFATNGICLAEYAVEVPYEGEPLSVVLPGAFAFKLAKSFFDHDNLLVSLTKSMIFVRTPNLVLGGTLIRDKYPEYQEFIPNPTEFAVINKHIFLDNLVNLTYEASSAEDSRVTARFSGGEVFLVCGSSDNEGIPTEFKGEFSFDCNLKMLANSIRNIPGEELKIGFTSPTKPLQFSSDESAPTGAKLFGVLVPLSAV